MFIHWGPVTLAKTEVGWSRQGSHGPEGAGNGTVPIDVYDNLYKRFAAEKFDAAQWVRVAQEGGFKYVVMISKHHDGFCLWNTKYTDYNIMHSPLGRDVIKEVADACHKVGMPLGIYYSQRNWHHPDYFGKEHQRYIEYMHNQLRELLTNYGKVSTLYLDSWHPGVFKAADWDSEKLFRMAHELQPQIVISNRSSLPGDYDSPECQIGAFQNDRPWESDWTITGSSWSWQGTQPVQSLESCLHGLLYTVGGDGNFLLNIGPKPDGSVEPSQIARTREIGDWLGKYGESIYGTRGGPFKPGRGIVSTWNGNLVYIHVLKWSGDTLTLPALPKKILASSLLTGGEVQMDEVDGQLTFAVQKPDQKEIDTIIKLTLDGPAAEIPALSPNATVSGLIAPTMKAAASSFFQSGAAYAPAKAIDGDPTTRWATDAGTHQAWLEVDLGKPMTFDRAAIGETYARVQSFELEYQDGEQWKSFYHGTTIGEGFLTPRLDAITAQHVRLNIVDASEGPSINELQLYAPRK